MGALSGEGEFMYPEPSGHANLEGKCNRPLSPSARTISESYEAGCA